VQQGLHLRLLEWGHRGLLAQVPVPGETGIHRLLLDRLTVHAQLLEVPTLDVCVHSPLTDLHPEPPESETGLAHSSRLCFSEDFCLCWSVWPATCVCASFAGVDMCLWWIHAQPLYGMDLGVWTCGCPASIRLLSLAAPITDYLQRHGLFSFYVHSSILLRKYGIKY